MEFDGSCWRLSEQIHSRSTPDGVWSGLELKTPPGGVCAPPEGYPNYLIRQESELMDSISSGVFDVATRGLELVLAHVSPTELLALALALVALVGTLVYAHRHRTGRVTLNARLAAEVDAAREVTR